MFPSFSNYPVLKISGYTKITSRIRTRSVTPTLSGQGRESLSPQVARATVRFLLPTCYLPVDFLSFIPRRKGCCYFRGFWPRAR